MTHIEINGYVKKLKGTLLKNIKRKYNIICLIIEDNKNVINLDRKEIYEIQLLFPCRMINANMKTILFASCNVYVPNSKMDVISNQKFNWNIQGNNLFDERIEKWNNEKGIIHIEEIDVNRYGDLRIKLSNNDIIETFTNTSTDRILWKFLEVNINSDQLIVTGKEARFFQKKYSAYTMPEEFEKFEDDVMKVILSEDEKFRNILEKQYKSAKIINREFTGVGFFTDFEIQDKTLKIENNPNFELGNIQAQLKKIEYGVGFVLFIRDGFITFLEGYTYDEPWPDDIKDYVLVSSTYLNYLGAVERNYGEKILDAYKTLTNIEK
jgi:hypothetical protein